MDKSPGDADRLRVAIYKYHPLVACSPTGILVVTLADGVEGYLRTSEISHDQLEDARIVLKANDDPMG